MNIRPMYPEEWLYSFKQSSQISGQTGLIGYLRANMDTDGNGFFSSWNDWRKDLKTDEFKAEFDEIINSLRKEGNILHNRKALANYCYSTPQSKMQTEYDYYGIRVDSEKYAYLMRLTPNSGKANLLPNLHCYCYVKDWLDGHMNAARKGIRFIDSHYNDLFRIPDGGKIEVHCAWNEAPNEVVKHKCRFIDDYHVEVSGTLFHICEYAERMEENGHTYKPVWDNLPERCYSILDSTGEIIIIKCGENGYFKTDISVTGKDEARELVDHYNKQLGVTKAQEAAMKVGSMVGFHVPGADPNCYDSNGNAINPLKMPCTAKEVAE